MPGTINREDIAAVRERAPIEEIVGQHVALRSAGVGSLKGLCPFHQEKTPSFNVNPDKGFFKCFGCGAGGDVLKFVELHQKLPFPEAVRYLAARAGIQVPEAEGGPDDRAAAAVREALLKVHETAAAFYREQLASAAGARARRELEQRGLRPETIETFGYGYAPAAIQMIPALIYWLDLLPVTSTMVWTIRWLALPWTLAALTLAALAAGASSNVRAVVIAVVLFVAANLFDVLLDFLLLTALGLPAASPPAGAVL